MKKERRIIRTSERLMMKRVMAESQTGRRAPRKIKFEGKAKRSKILKRKRTSSRTEWNSGSTNSQPK